MRATPPRDWSAIKALFAEAIELDGDQRRAFLDRACGADGELRSEVESLLAAHDDQRPFLEAPPVAGVASAIHDAFAVTEAVSTGLEQGTRIAQYEVLEPLGSGGMGDVYRARDTRLDRLVALKVVQEQATGRTADRLLREARAASALNHPNICTLYEASEFDGRPYLAMEYIAGQPLSSVMPPQGLPASVVVEYARQIADALAHAHDHGVIHRDLKSANVVVTPQGRAKVLDFGIAKRLTTIGAGSFSGTVSEAGTISGTLAYMAPELLRESPADARSDIWALGVLLYELASGRRPFVGETAFELSSAILKDPVPDLPPKLPPVLRAVILRCLERDPDARFQRASDIVAALEASPLSRASRPRRRTVLGLTTAGIALVLAGYAVYDWRGRSAKNVSEVRATIAVLPFKVLSGTEEIGFLGIGVPDTIISRIALVGSIRVMAVLAPGRENDDPRATGQTLGVDYVLTGTIQKVADQIRVTPQLVRVDEGVATWGRPYTLRTTDLLRLQDEIARGVVEALPVQLTSEDRARMDRQQTRDSEAYALYLRGRTQLTPYSRAATLGAVAAFEQALTRDPDYALAHAGLAVASARMRHMFATEDEVKAFTSQSHQAARRALALDPELAEAHEALAAVYRSSEFEWLQAIEESTRALERNASLDQPHLFKASAFVHLGLLDRATPAAQAARDSNRANVAEPLRVMGTSAIYGGQYAAAVSLLEQAREASGEPAEWNLAYAYYYAGRTEEAESMLRHMRGKSARSQRRAQATLASFLAARGQTADAMKLLDAVTTPGSYMDHHVAYSIGAAYAQLRRPEEALQWLAQAWNTGFQCYPWFDLDPLLAGVRPRPEFRSVFDEFKQSWETKKAQYRAER